MENILNKSLKAIDDIINKTDTKSLDFYSRIVEIMSSLFKNSHLGIFFFENVDCTLKKANLNLKDYKFNQALIDEFLEEQETLFEKETKKDEFLLEKTILIKLAIKESVFGFFAISRSSAFLEDEKTSLLALVNIISYKIKDFELNEVFKIQLKALQEAIEEKESAYIVIKRQHKKLQEADKTKNLFLANISHELRTPLNAIIGFSQALDSKIFGDLNEKQAEYIKDIQISSLHLLGMINEILDISKLEADAMKFSPVEINPDNTIKEVVSILEPLYKNKKIDVEFHSCFNGLIKADYQKFQQILYNLLSNAIKFTPEQGKIEITTDFKNKNYFLKIKDTGIGIDKKYHNKIFKKFVHLNHMYTKNQSSTGLGLTIVKELVKLHNGKISLESALNKGTTFLMEFKNIIV